MKKKQKEAECFHCNLCDFSTYKKSNYDAHLLTSKHKNRTTLNDLEQKTIQNKPKHMYVCEKCNKEYKARNSLWYHEKKCQMKNNKCKDEDEEKEKEKDNIISLLLTQNKELMDLIKSGLINSTTNTNTNTNTNSHNVTNNANSNNTFNLQFFLNETCKDAMNISDFVSSIDVTLEELENTGRQGYIEGISNIILKRLNVMEQHLRPLHCSDAKREIFYIKDNNEWKKEVDGKPILTNSIKTIANENIKQIGVWRSNYPDCTKSNSKKNDLYLKIVSNSMNGLTKEEGEKNISKIITNIAKKVTINKSNNSLI
jgi:hypothetical protein